MKEYTVQEAADILGMKKSSLHSIIQMGGIKSTKRKVNGVPTRHISEKELKEYAKEKVKRHKKALDKMNNEFLNEIS